jgi:hypothetical protein
MFDYFRGVARDTAGGELAYEQDEAQVVGCSALISASSVHSPLSFIRSTDLVVIWPKADIARDIEQMSMRANIDLCIWTPLEFVCDREPKGFLLLR